MGVIPILQMKKQFRVKALAQGDPVSEQQSEWSDGSLTLSSVLHPWAVWLLGWGGLGDGRLGRIGGAGPACGSGRYW